MTAVQFGLLRNSMGSNVNKESIGSLLTFTLMRVHLALKISFSGEIINNDAMPIIEEPLPS